MEQIFNKTVKEETTTPELPPQKAVAPSHSGIDVKEEEETTTPELPIQREDEEEEWDEEEENPKKGQEYFKTLVNKGKQRSNTCTKFCKHYTNCTFKNCNFAHSPEQLVVNPCGYGNECCHIFIPKNGKVLNNFKSHKVCKFIHPNEDKVQYMNRVEMKEPQICEEEIYRQGPKKKINLEDKNISIKVPREIFTQTVEYITSQGYTNVEISIV